MSLCRRQRSEPGKNPAKRIEAGGALTLSLWGLRLGSGKRRLQLAKLPKKNSEWISTLGRRELEAMTAALRSEKGCNPLKPESQSANQVRESMKEAG
jgi:hypothetical protein